LGIVYRQCDDPFWRRVVLTEMLARTLKQIIRSTMRRLRSPSSAPYVQAVVEIFDSVFGTEWFRYAKRTKKKKQKKRPLINSGMGSRSNSQELRSGRSSSTASVEELNGNLEKEQSRSADLDQSFWELQLVPELIRRFKLEMNDLRGAKESTEGCKSLEQSTGDECSSMMVKVCVEEVFLDALYQRVSQFVGLKTKLKRKKKKKTKNGQKASPREGKGKGRKGKEKVKPSKDDLNDKTDPEIRKSELEDDHTMRIKRNGLIVEATLVPRVKRIHRFHFEEGIALSKLAASQERVRSLASSVNLASGSPTNQSPSASPLLSNSSHSTDSESYLGLAEEQYREALQRNPSDARSLHNWALLLYIRAGNKSSAEAEELYKLSGKKFKAAFNLEPTDYRVRVKMITLCRFSITNWQALFKWANCLFQRAKLHERAGEITEQDQSRTLYQRAIEKYERAASLNGDGDPELLFNWANALYCLANLDFQVNNASRSPASASSGSRGLQSAATGLIAACTKYKMAHRLCPQSSEIVRNWAVAMRYG
jgi:tetratricopeptide (TPR) repeat protein